MGFRDFRAFNQALLAKTAWRVIQNPNDYWCRILKGLYFPKCGMMEAKKGNKASWCWSSILEGRELLKKRVCWKINRGESVRIWKDAWVPGLKGAKLEGVGITEEMKKQKVSFLVVQGRWDLSSIRECISEGEKEEILKIRIPMVEGNDTLIWLPCKDGVFTVKSGYHVARSREAEKEVARPRTSFQITKQMWSCVWGLNVPLKVKQFIWRMFNGAVPTKEALYKRKCSNSPLCPVCAEEVESYEHLLFLCPWAKTCRFGCSLGIMVNENNITSAEKWFTEMFLNIKGVGEEEKALIAILCWEIWKGRCGWVFNEQRVNAVRVIKYATELTRECSKENKREDAMKQRYFKKQWLREEKWVAPASGEVKINVDGSFNSSLKCSGIGVVCRDSFGHFLGGCGDVVNAESALMAECLAVKEGLNTASRFEAKKIWLETDCEVLYRILNGIGKINCEWQSVDMI